VFRGWLSLGGQELTNTSRLLANAAPTPSDDLLLAGAQCTSNCKLDFVVYDDSWPGLRSYLGDPAYTITSAPWYDASVPQSAEFLGVWVTKIDGDGPTPVDRSVNDAICPGGVAGPSRDKYRQLTIEVLLVGCTNPGVVFGMEWVACQLRAAKGLAGTTLDFLSAHPEDSAASAASLHRTMNRVVLTQEPRITDRYPSGAQNRQGRMLTCTFELTVLDPYTYGPATVETITWDSTVTEAITWAHPPSCQDPSSCDAIPVLASVDCTPNIVDTRPALPPICSGCTPICSVQTRTKVLPEATGSFCVDAAYTFTITAGSGNDVSGNFWLRPCGDTAMCDRTAFLSLSGLPAGSTVVADAVAGRAYALVGGEQIRQLGIVYTPSGAPWTPAIVDSSECWELVAQHAPGLSFTVAVSVQGRSA
jgi:hypothetical protein